MSTPSTKRQLLRLFDKQCGRCCYCGGDTWLPGKETKVQAKIRLGIPLVGNGGTKLVRASVATREHIKRRVDGGKNSNNLAMACNACNTFRLESPPDVHRIDMQVLVAAGLHPTNRPKILDSPKDHIKRGLRALRKLRAGQPITTGENR